MTPVERAAEVIDALEPFALEVRDVQRGWLAKEIAQALSDAGMLAEGVPSLEQIARAIDPDAWEHVDACHTAMKVASEEQLKVLRSVIDHRLRHSGGIPAAERVSALLLPTPPAEG